MVKKLSFLQKLRTFVLLLLTVEVEEALKKSRWSSSCFWVICSMSLYSPFRPNFSLKTFPFFKLPISTTTNTELPFPLPQSQNSKNINIFIKLIYFWLSKKALRSNRTSRFPSSYVCNSIANSNTVRFSAAWFLENEVRANAARVIESTFYKESPTSSILWESSPSLISN